MAGRWRPGAIAYGQAMASQRLQGRVALITGAAGGIGACVARRLGEDGATLLLTDTDADGVWRTAAELAELGGSVAARGHDVTSEAEWEAVSGWALEKEGRVDVLVNNAGVFLAAALGETSLEDFRRVLDVNVVGVFLGMRAVVPTMTTQQGGSIINVSSVAGLMGSPYLSAYAASKWAVRGMTKVVAKETARFGVRVNSVHPGQIDTDMNARQREATPELVERLIRSIPLQRIGTPEEVAHAVAYLACDESLYVTGSELVIDGGSSA